MLRAIGIALVEVEQPTQLVEGRLLQIAAQYTTEPVRVVVLPTMLMIQVGNVGYEVDGSTHASLQLDMARSHRRHRQPAAVGAITPADAVAAIEAARTLRPRFGPVLTTIGYAVTTVGFRHGDQPDLGIAARLSVPRAGGRRNRAVGRPFPGLNPMLPTLSATIVTALATWFVADTAHDGLLRVIAPPLVATLPGMALTIGAMELAASQIISGSSRLVYGMPSWRCWCSGWPWACRSPGGVPAEPSAQMGAWSLSSRSSWSRSGSTSTCPHPGGRCPGSSPRSRWPGGAEPGRDGDVRGPLRFVGAILVVPFSMVAARVKTAPSAS